MSDAEETYMSDVFPPDSKPLRMTQDELLRVLDRLRAAVAAGDSMEGSILYGWSSEPDLYDVGGLFRVGNAMGQGGAVVLWDTSR